MYEPGSETPDFVRNTDDDGRNYCGDAWCGGHVSATDQCVPEPSDEPEDGGLYDSSNRYMPRLLPPEFPLCG